MLTASTLLRTVTMCTPAGDVMHEKERDNNQTVKEHSLSVGLSNRQGT